MRWPQFTRRTKIALIAFVVLAAIGFLPLRLALGLAGIGEGELSARQVRGPIWYGRIDDLMVGGINLGTVNVAVSPLQLLVGRVRLDLWRKEGQPGDIAGAWTSGFNQRGIDDVTGVMPAAGLFAPLPVGTMEFDDVTAHFAGDTCSKAEGRLRLRLASQYAGLNLTQGLAGDAKCDGKAILFPLVSQTGMERLSLRIWRDGKYTMQVAVTAGDGANAAALALAGMTQSGKDYVLTFEGQM
ncbi:MAG: type II secretion system protein N [Sphingobium sp.]